MFDLEIPTNLTIFHFSTSTYIL